VLVIAEIKNKNWAIYRQFKQVLKTQLMTVSSCFEKGININSLSTLSKDTQPMNLMMYHPQIKYSAANNWR